MNTTIGLQLSTFYNDPERQNRPIGLYTAFLTDRQTDRRQHDAKSRVQQHDRLKM